ncbi:MAG: LacI family transcriptional regulator [Microbacteriaceae bacterium]|nr:LacI family transcriptional regulator [Microbacteriaceae bacterium]
MSASRVKLVDVARRAGVSPATVSRVLNGNAPVSKATLERVQTAASELGYRRNTLASSLRRRASRLIGVVVPDVANPFYTEVVRGIEDQLRGAGYLLVLCNSDGKIEKQTEYLRLLSDQQLDGVILAPATPDLDKLEDAVASGLTVVLIDRRVASTMYDTVTVANRDDARILTAGLLAASRRIAHIGGPHRTSTAQDRFAGFLDAHASAGVDPDPGLIFETDYSEQGGYEAMKSLLKLEQPPAGVFVGNNVMTLGVLRALSETETAAAPKIVSFDPLPWWASSVHPVTTGSQPSYELGRTAAELLLLRLADPGREYAEVTIGHESGR